MSSRIPFYAFIVLPLTGSCPPYAHLTHVGASKRSLSVAAAASGASPALVAGHSVWLCSINHLSKELLHFVHSRNQNFWFWICKLESGNSLQKLSPGLLNSRVCLRRAADNKRRPSGGGRCSRGVRDTARRASALRCFRGKAGAVVRPLLRWGRRVLKAAPPQPGQWRPSAAGCKKVRGCLLIVFISYLKPMLTPPTPHKLSHARWKFKCCPKAVRKFAPRLE